VTLCELREDLLSELRAMQATVDEVASRRADVAEQDRASGIGLRPLHSWRSSTTESRTSSNTCAAFTWFPSLPARRGT